MPLNLKALHMQGLGQRMQRVNVAGNAIIGAAGFPVSTTYAPAYLFVVKQAAAMNARHRQPRGLAEISAQGCSPDAG